MRAAPAVRIMGKHPTWSTASAVNECVDAADAANEAAPAVAQITNRGRAARGLVYITAHSSTQVSVRS